MDKKTPNNKKNILYYARSRSKIILLIIIASTLSYITSLSQNFSPTKDEIIQFGMGQAWIDQLEQRYSKSIELNASSKDETPISNHINTNRSNSPMLLPPGFFFTGLIIYSLEKIQIKENYPIYYNDKDKKTLIPNRSNLTNHFTSYSFNKQYLTAGRKFLSKNNNLLTVRSISNLVWMLNGLAISLILARLFVWCRIVFKDEKWVICCFFLLIYTANSSIIALSGVFSLSNFIILTLITFSELVVKYASLYRNSTIIKTSTNLLYATLISTLTTIGFLSGGINLIILMASIAIFIVYFMRNYQNILPHLTDQPKTRLVFFLTGECIFLFLCWLSYGMSLTPADHYTLEKFAFDNSIHIPFSEFLIGALSRIYNVSDIFYKSCTIWSENNQTSCNSLSARFVSLLAGINLYAVFFAIIGVISFFKLNFYHFIHNMDSKNDKKINNHPILIRYIGLFVAMSLFFSIYIGRMSGGEESIKTALLVPINIGLFAIGLTGLIFSNPYLAKERKHPSESQYLSIIKSLFRIRPLNIAFITILMMIGSNWLVAPFYNLANCQIPGLKFFAEEEENLRNQSILMQIIAEDLIKNNEKSNILCNYNKKNYNNGNNNSKVASSPFSKKNDIVSIKSNIFINKQNDHNLYVFFADQMISPQLVLLNSTKNKNYYPQSKVIKNDIRKIKKLPASLCATSPHQKSDILSPSNGCFIDREAIIFDKKLGYYHRLIGWKK